MDEKIPDSHEPDNSSCCPEESSEDHDQYVENLLNFGRKLLLFAEPLDENWTDLSDHLEQRARACLERARKHWHQLDAPSVSTQRIETVVRWLEQARIDPNIGPEIGPHTDVFRDFKIKLCTTRIVEVETRRDPCGLGKIPAEDWIDAINEWRGRNATHGGKGGRYAWHRVVYKLLKKHDLTRAATPKRMLDAVKRARGE